MSKIAAVKAYPIIAKLKNVQRTAQESRADVELLLVEVITDDGVKGYGQVTSTPMPEIKKWVERFGEEVKGMDALARVAVWDHLLSMTSPRPNLGGLSRAAMAATNCPVQTCSTLPSPCRQAPKMTSSGWQ